MNPLFGRRAIDARDALRARPTGIAFRSPVAMIRHRFDGNLRAAWSRASVRSRYAPHVPHPTRPDLIRGTVETDSEQGAGGG